MGKNSGPNPELSLVGDGLWIAGVSVWAYKKAAEKNLGFQWQADAHSRLCSEKVQAFIAHRLRLRIEESTPEDERARVLSQSLEAQLGQLYLGGGSEMAIEWVGGLLDHLPERVLLYVSDEMGGNIPGGEEWNYKETKPGKEWLAWKGECSGFGKSKDEARHDAVFNFYFRSH